VQVDPIKPTLTAPGTKRLKLKCDGPLSIFAFNFNLRRYTVASDVKLTLMQQYPEEWPVSLVHSAGTKVRRCWMTLSNPSSKRLDLSA